MAAAFRRTDPPCRFPVGLRWRWRYCLRARCCIRTRDGDGDGIAVRQRSRDGLRPCDAFRRRGRDAEHTPEHARLSHGARPLSWRGVSLAGAEFSESSLPGTYGTDYIYPAADSVGYFKAKGMNLVRLPFRWERLQPQLNQLLDTVEIGRVKAFVDAATAEGVTVLLDVHNYARWHGDIIGSAAVPNSAFPW